MSGDVHVRICEHLGGRFPGVTLRSVYVRSQKAGADGNAETLQSTSFESERKQNGSDVFL